MWEALIDKLKSILDGIDTIAEVYDYEINKFKGDPGCTITPSENSNDYVTSCENVRIYAFNIRVFISRSITDGKSVADEYADRRMRALVDLIINAYDKDYTLTGMVVPTGYTFINLFAVPSLWGYSGRDDEYRSCEISIKCRVSVDINNI